MMRTVVTLSRKMRKKSIPICIRYFSHHSNFREQYGHWIGGKEMWDGNGFAVEDPARRKTLTMAALATPETVNLAVKSAQEAFDSGIWSNIGSVDRARVMEKAASLLRDRVMDYADAESLQTGRAVREMRAQLQRLPEWLEYFAALVRTHEGSVPPFGGEYLNYVRREPLGVVAQITPWNHPMLIAIKKIAPALATGNSIVLKPSELAPCTVIEFARLLSEAGLPNGVLNVISGDSTAGKALVENPIIRKVDLTGGTPTGRSVSATAGKNLTGCIMELGGKAPMIVFDDVDIQQTVNTTVFGSFIASGQTCIAGTRLLVQKNIFDEVVNRYVDKVKSIRLGDPMDTATQMGPVISQPQLNKVEEFVELARNEGARVLCGGKRPNPSELPKVVQNGYYYRPTVIGDVTPDMRVVQDEIFGPVVVAYSFEDEEDAIRLANYSPFGLAAAVWTKDVARAHRVAGKLDVGIVWVNDHHRNDPSSPWGGCKESGIGRENGVEALLEYTQAKSVVVRTDPAPFDWFVADENVRYS